VCGEQGYEVEYFARKHGITKPDCATSWLTWLLRFIGLRFFDSGRGKAD
jgi:hypothetical protein